MISEERVCLKLIAVFAYRYARNHINDPAYAFGTGKVNVLGGFASAIALAVVALVMLVESLQRIVNPQSNYFNEATAVACLLSSFDSSTASPGSIRAHKKVHALWSIQKNSARNIVTLREALHMEIIITQAGIDRYTGIYRGCNGRRADTED